MFCGAGLWTLYFSGKSAAEYAENLLERNLVQRIENIDDSNMIKRV